MSAMTSPVRRGSSVSGDEVEECSPATSSYGSVAVRRWSPERGPSNLGKSTGIAEEYRTRCKRLFPAMQRVAGMKFAERNSRSQVIHKPISAATIARQTAVDFDVGIALRPAQLEDSDGSMQQPSEKTSQPAAVQTSVRSELHPITKTLLAELELIPKDEVAKLDYDDLFWLKRKFDEISLSVRSFIRNKRNKVARTIVHQQAPPFSSGSIDMNWILSFGNLTHREAEYLFHFFKSVCDFPSRQHWRRSEFDSILPSSLPVPCKEVLFDLFRDKFYIQMGLDIVTHRSFIPTLTALSRGSLRERCQLLTHIFTCWHLGHLQPEHAHLARHGQSVTIPYVTKERVLSVVMALQSTKDIIVMPETNRRRLTTKLLDDDEFELVTGEEDLFRIEVRRSVSDESMVSERDSVHVFSEATTDDEGAVNSSRPSHQGTVAEFDEEGFNVKFLQTCTPSQINGRQVCLLSDSDNSDRLHREVERALEELFPRHIATVGPSTPNSCASFEFCERLYRIAQDNLGEPFWRELLHGFGMFSYFHELIVHTMETDLALPARRWTTTVRKEGFLDKNSYRGPFERWREHWCEVGAGFFWYYDCDEAVPSMDSPERVVCLNRCNVDIVRGRGPHHQSYFVITGSNYERKFSLADEGGLYEWVNALRNNMSLEAASALPASAFSVPREGITATPYVDGKEAFEAIYEALCSAKEEVFIASWFLSPELYLVRENRDGDIFLDEASRLDTLLLSLAQRGVRIFVLPWNETKVVMDLGSARVKEHLEALHPNIFVLLHPLVSPVKWSHHQKLVVVDQDIAFVGGLDLAFGRYDDRHHQLRDDAAHSTYLLASDNAMPRWPGKDYYNPSVCQFEEAFEPWLDSVDRFSDPRMGWHDVHMSVDGLAARDVAYNFIQRWNHHKEVLQATSRYPYILPKLSAANSSGSVRCQVLRSLSEWSGGLGEFHEASIYAAYLKVISEARHFVYIENQYFISSLAGGDVKNRIALCILERVSRAIENDERFRVIIVLPVHPEGNLRDPDPQQQDQSIRYVMKWQAQTICFGEDSLLGALRCRFPGTDLARFISFNSLVSFVQFDDVFCMEQIYVHSKLLIVDDRVVIMGSANINDRSMLGPRDSEICVHVQNDLDQSNSFMYGTPVLVTSFAHNLRVKLWAEHLGLEKEEEKDALRDPLSAYQLWAQAATNNSMIYKTLFPDRNMARCPPSEYAIDQLSRVQGHLVMYDFSYLEGEAAKFAGGVTMTDDVYV